MAFATIFDFGWRVRARRQSVSGAASGRLTRAAIAALAAGLASALIWVSLNDTFAVSALLRRFGSIHAFFGAVLVSGALFAGLSAFSSVAGAILLVAEAAPKIAFGGALLGALPFAQLSDTPAGKTGAGEPSTSLRPEMQVGFYMGQSIAPRSDIRIKGPDDTDLTLKKVKWKSESFKPSPYYGARGVDWNSRMPAFGAMVDYTHAKATAIRSQILNQTGRFEGRKLPESEPFGVTIRKIEFTHGLNFLAINGVFRSGGLHRRIIPYVGLGFGFTVPFAHVRFAGKPKKEQLLEAQLTGMAYQVLGGIEWRIFKSDRRSLFTEYKLTYTTQDVDLRKGRRLYTDILIHQFNVGGYYTPWRQGAGAR